MAATGAPLLSSDSTTSVVGTTSLAPWLQTRTQLPQPMQRSGITSACRCLMRMALAGHRRTQVKQSRQRFFTVRT